VQPSLALLEQLSPHLGERNDRKCKDWDKGTKNEQHKDAPGDFAIQECGLDFHLVQTG